MAECPFCGLDPFDYVDIGIGYEPVAVTCCVFGMLYFERGLPLEFVRELYEESDGRMNGCDWEGLKRELAEWKEERGMSRSLTAEKLIETYKNLLVPFYYCETTHIERGEVCLVSETEYSPEYIMIHPDDFDEVSSKLRAIGRRLVHLRDYEPDLESAPTPLT